MDIKKLITPTRKALLLSWLRLFVGGFVSILVAAAIANIEAGTIPPLSGIDFINAFWSAIGATLVVVYNYLNPNDARYGNSKPENLEE